MCWDLWCGGSYLMPAVPPGPGHSEAPRSSLSESRALSAFAERSKDDSSVSQSTQLRLALQHEFASFYHCAPGKAMSTYIFLLLQRVHFLFDSLVLKLHLVSLFGLLRQPVLEFHHLSETGPVLQRPCTSHTTMAATHRRTCLLYVSSWPLAAFAFRSSSSKPMLLCTNTVFFSSISLF